MNKGLNKLNLNFGYYALKVAKSARFRDEANELVRQLQECVTTAGGYIEGMVRGLGKQSEMQIVFSNINRARYICKILFDNRYASDGTINRFLIACNQLVEGLNTLTFESITQAPVKAKPLPVRKVRAEDVDPDGFDEDFED